ncbi:MAG: hypothetical protein V5A22_11430 [Salinivenus sp.]
MPSRIRKFLVLALFLILVGGFLAYTYHDDHTLRPDVHVERTIDGVQAGRDETLQTARRLLDDSPSTE